MVPPGDRPSAGETVTSTFVMIHGAWHGGWCWARVAGGLRERGHTVLCPDLPGHGVEGTPPGTVTMRSYTEAVEQILQEMNEPAVLVGHSLGGAVVSQVCESRPEMVHEAVYVSAFLLRDGESVWRHQSPPPEAVTFPSVLSTANLRMDGKARTLDIDPEVIPEGFYNGCPPNYRADALARWKPEPLAPMLTSLSLSDDRFGRVPRVYVACRNDHVIPFAGQELMCRLAPCEVITTMDCGHSPFLSHPEELAAVLERL